MNLEYIALSLGPLQTNCYLVAEVTSGKAVVIDPGDEPWKILHELAMREWDLDAVWITHAHFDHIAACGELQKETGCPVCLHSKDLPLWWMKGAAELFGLHIPALPESPTLWMDYPTLGFGTAEAEIIALPGHTPGHVGFYFADPGLLFCGDTIFANGGRGRTDGPGGDERALLESIQKTIFSFPDSIRLLPGHGEPSTVGAEKQTWQAVDRFNPPPF